MNPILVDCFNIFINQAVFMEHATDLCKCILSVKPFVLNS